ncbi:MAG TPA: thioredoxin domain-containing protein, partial [Terracidiphilus sp.]|nr:thioredoxin domain-containing protein [Terracidiphilus sp.]
FAATYGIAVLYFLESPVQVVVIADENNRPAGELCAAALAPFAFTKTVLRLSPNQAVPQNLPPLLAQTIPHLPQLHSGQPFAVLCSGTACQPPVSDAGELKRQLEGALSKPTP